MSKQIDNLSKAKSMLVVSQPFFASLLLSMPMIEDSKVKTMATNGDEIRYNPKFLDSLSLPETTFVLAHETLHCVFQHMFRRGDRNANKWNIAADYVINETLVNERVGIMPKGGLHNPKLVQDGNGTTEGVYKLLPDSDNDKGAGDEGGALDEVQDAGKDAAETSQKEAEMRVKVVNAARAAKACGKLSAGLDRMVKEMTKSRIDWRAVLRRFLSERAKVDLSFAKPKRRFLAEDIYLPGLTGEKLGEIVFAVDCSGSIDDETLNLFATEMRAIQEDTKPIRVHVLYFDTEVLRADSFEADEPLEVSACGGGGTAFSPVFDRIAELNLNPAACVFLTDLCCNDFGKDPGYPVLWASTGRDAGAPFGEVVEIKE